MGASFAYTMAQLAEMSDIGGTVLFNASPAIFNMQLEDRYGVVSLGASMEKEISNFQKDIKVDEITSIKDAGRWVAGSTTQLIPSLSLAFTGPAAMPLFFASGLLIWACILLNLVGSFLFVWACLGSCGDLVWVLAEIPP